MINWKDNTKEFKDFDEQTTRTWLNDNFTREEAREWLKIFSHDENFNATNFFSSFFAWLRDIKKLTPAQYHNQYQSMTYEQKAAIDKDFEDYESAENMTTLCVQCFKMLTKDSAYEIVQEVVEQGGQFGLCSADCKVNREGKQFIFTEEYFKAYLRRNVKKGWFDKSPNGVWYQTISGNYNSPQYADKYTIGLKDIIIDPSVTIDRMISVSRQNDSQINNMRMATKSANDHGRFMNTIGLDDNYTVVNHYHHYQSISYIPYQSPETTYYLSQINTYSEDVFFTLFADNSKWIVHNVLVNRVVQIAEDVCKWSNQVYQEKFEIKQFEIKRNDQKIESLIYNLESKLNISSSSSIELEKKISLKEKELSRKEKIFNLYIEKNNEDGIERLEKEITALETEIDDLKSQLISSEITSFQLQN